MTIFPPFERGQKKIAFGAEEDEGISFAWFC